MTDLQQCQELLQRTEDVARLVRLAMEAKNMGHALAARCFIRKAQELMQKA